MFFVVFFCLFVCLAGCLRAIFFEESPSGVHGEMYVCLCVSSWGPLNVFLFGLDSENLCFFQTSIN